MFERWFQARGYELVETFVEAGASAANDRRPEFQRMMEAGTTKAAAFDVVIVRSFVTPAKLHTFAEAARRRLRGPLGGYRRVHLRALVQRVEVADGEVRIMGSKSRLLQMLAAPQRVPPSTEGVPTSVLKWRPGRDSNP